MGSFNVACTVSNISISPGMPVTYLPLKMSVEGKGDALINGKNYLFHPWCHYAPLTLPIFGIYDDYGRISDIERNENVWLLEEKFGINIEDIFNHDEKFPYTGMFIHRDIWDTMVNDQRNEFGEVVKDKKGNKGYYGNYGDEYYLEQFNILRDHLTKLAEIQKELDSMENDSSNEKYLELSIEAMRMDVCSETEYNIFRFRHYIHFIGEDINKDINMGNVKNLFYDLYKEKIQNGDMFEELLALKKFEISMNNCNCFYSPAINGTQFGNPEAHKVVVEKTLEILNKDIKKREEWDE